eukprot:gene28198-34501_t
MGPPIAVDLSLATAECWRADGTLGTGNVAWHGTMAEAVQRCISVGAECQWLLDWNCDSGHGNRGWRYCRAVPATGDAQSCAFGTTACIPPSTEQPT